MEIKQYVLPLLKWWWLIVAATLIATVSSFAAVRQQPAIYRTRATVMVGSAIENPNPSGNELYLTQQLANTYADIVKRDSVRIRTMDTLGLSWLPEYTARVVASTNLIELTVTDTSPERAQAVAGELVHQLVLLSPQNPAGEGANRQAFVTRQLDDLQVKIEETQAEIVKKTTQLGDLFSARQIADTEMQIAGLQDKLSTLQANYAALLSNTQAGALNTITLIEPAAVPSVPVGPQRMATILLAAAIGLALSAGAAYLLEYLDDTLKNPDNVQAVLGLPTLGAVPRVDGEISGAEADLVVLDGRRSTAIEAYRVLRTNLQFASVKQPLRALMVTSAAPGEGKSTMAANLAAILALEGKQVILVDTDLRRPRLHKVFGLRNSTGVTSALVEQEQGLEGVIQATKVPRLRILTSGPLPPNAAELLGSERMAGLITELRAQADVVIFDSPPVVAVADAAILSTQCDGVLFVLKAGRTRRDEARRALEALRHVDAHLVGAVLSQMPSERQGYYYYYRYGHNYGYGHEKRRRNRLMRGWRRPQPQPLAQTRPQREG